MGAYRQAVSVSGVGDAKVGTAANTRAARKARASFMAILPSVRSGASGIIGQRGGQGYFNYSGKAGLQAVDYRLLDSVAEFSCAMTNASNSSTLQ